MSCPKPSPPICDGKYMLQSFQSGAFDSRALGSAQGEATSRACLVPSAASRSQAAATIKYSRLFERAVAQA